MSTKYPRCSGWVAHTNRFGQRVLEKSCGGVFATVIRGRRGGAVVVSTAERVHMSARVRGADEAALKKAAQQAMGRVLKTG